VPADSKAYIVGLLSEYVGLISASPITNQLIFHFNYNFITSFFLALCSSLINVLKNVRYATRYYADGCEQDRQYAYIVILMRVRVTIVAAEKSIRITYSEYVSVDLFIQYAMRM
jgi:hypothetical protein